MTAEIATALRETADRATVAALVAEAGLAARAMQLAEAVAFSEQTEPLVAEFLDARAAWIDLDMKRREAQRAAQDAERELAHANPFQADAEAWTNERALQRAETEKEAHA